MKWAFAVPMIAVVVSGAIWWCAGANRAQEPRPEAAPAVGGEPNPSASAAGVVVAPQAYAASAQDPVAVGPCVLTPIQDQEVSSQVDGVLDRVHVALGQQVGAGECLAQLNCRKLQAQVDMLDIRAKSNAAELIARAQLEEAEARVAYAIKANSGGIKSVADLEFKTYVCQRDRFAEEVKKAREEQEAAKKELEAARVLLQLHQIRSALSGEVVKVCKKAGESVKQSETLFRVARTDRLRVEGFCKVQYANQLKPGLAVAVEPERQGPQQRELTGHTGSVTSLAVTPDGKLLVSAGEDGDALVWAWPGGTRLAALTHPAPVLAVAVAPAGDQPATRYRVVTGCADRSARLWTVSATGQVDGPVMLNGHDGGVRAACFSPDGRLVLTGGDDRRIACWDAATGSLRFWVHAAGAWKEAAHQGAVTSIRTTADGYLASAGRDNVLKIWKLGQSGAALTKILPGRTGDVQQLDVLPGGAVCFDHGDELRLLDKRTGAVVHLLRNHQHGAFKEFAHFSPSGRLALTAAANGRIQLWKSPNSDPLPPAAADAGGDRSSAALALLGGLHRPLAATPLMLALAHGNGTAEAAQLSVAAQHRGGFELRHYHSPNAAAVKCAAFAPNEKVFFTGGSDRVIRVWSIPPEDDWRPHAAVLSFIGNEVEPGTDLVRIQAVLDNSPSGPRRLLPGTSVTLKVVSGEW